MALIRYAEGQQRSGSIGGSTYSRNRGGQYIRTRAIPTNPSTARQLAVRNNLAQLSDRWQNILTQVQRDAWAVYASNTPVTNPLGEQILLSGLNMYIRGNAPRLQAAVALVDDGPSLFGLPDPPVDMALGISAPFTLNGVVDPALNAWAAEDDAYLLTYTGRPQNPTINYFSGPYRFSDALAGDSTTPPTLISGTTAYTYAAAQVAWAYAQVSRADGRLSPRQVFRLTVS